MSAEVSHSLLSRDELGALLDSAMHSGRHGGGDASPRPIGLLELTGARAQFDSVATRFASEQGRSLSTLYQRSIDFDFSHWEEITLRQFSSALLDTDRLVRFTAGPEGSPVHVLISRPLVFRWLTLAFGGSQIDPTNDVVPARAYTRIEERFICRAAGEIAATLHKTLGGHGEVDSELVLESPAALLGEVKRPHMVASFEINGLGEPSALRIAMPSASVSQKRVERPVLPPSPTEGVGPEVMEVAVELAVQVGFADLSLQRVAELAVGDEIPLERFVSDGLVVRVEDKNKFRAEPGKLGSKLAFRITEVL